MFDFGASVGTDYLQSTLTAHSTTRSWAFWCRFDGIPYTQFPRFFDKGGNEAFFYSDIALEFRFLRSWTSADEQWGWSTATLGALTHVVLTYDSSSTANDPVCYYNGVLQTLTTNAAPTGSLTDNAGNYYFANRAGQDRALDGVMAEIAIWDVILTADEAAALGADLYSPQLIRPTALVEYIPCVRQAVSLKRGAPTLNGGSVVAHPRVFYPHRRLILPAAAAAVGTQTKTASLDAILQKSLTKTASLDALIQKVLTATASLDAVLEAGTTTVTKTASLDALLRKNDITSTAQLNALLQKTLTATADLNAVLQKAQTKNASLDALLQKTLTRTAALDALLQKRQTLAASLDAVVTNVNTVDKTASVDAILQKTFLPTASLDALLQKAQSITASLDAVITDAAELVGKPIRRRRGRTGWRKWLQEQEKPKRRVLSAAELRALMNDAQFETRLALADSAREDLAVFERAVEKIEKMLRDAEIEEDDIEAVISALS